MARPDFPFYDGRPVRIPVSRWLVALLLCALAFALLGWMAAAWPDMGGRFAGMSAFGVVNLLALYVAAGRFWSRLFPPLARRDVLVGLGGALLTMTASLLIALLVLHGRTPEPNQAVAILAGSSPLEAAIFLAGTLPQLMGEELITILPFLALMTLAHRGLGLPRGAAIMIAWTGSALIFAALHLPTYNWRLLQTLAVIGVARLALTVPFLMTRNLWASTIAHVVHDWTIFGILALQGLVRP